MINRITALPVVKDIENCVLFSKLFNVMCRIGCHQYFLEGTGCKVTAHEHPLGQDLGWIFQEAPCDERRKLLAGICRGGARVDTSFTFKCVAAL